MNQKKLKNLLSYDVTTGIFLWKNPPKHHSELKGKIAGCGKSGYWVIRIEGKAYRAHNLAWLYVYGRMPKKEIDHEDTNNFNNAIKNLRECSNPQNQANKKRISGKRLPKGVKKYFNRYIARITFNKKQIHIGCFGTAQEASDAYFEKAKELYGKFARRD